MRAEYAGRLLWAINRLRACGRLDNMRTGVFVWRSGGQPMAKWVGLGVAAMLGSRTKAAGKSCQKAETKRASGRIGGDACMLNAIASVSVKNKRICLIRLTYKLIDE